MTLPLQFSFYQTKALAFGKGHDEVRAEGTLPEFGFLHASLKGNRPTTSIFGKSNPRAIGTLIALYEHITFVEGVVGIDSALISGVRGAAEKQLTESRFSCNS